MGTIEAVCNTLGWDVRLTLSQEEIADVSPTQMVIQKYDPNTQAWETAYQKQIALAADANVTLSDPYTAALQTYQYKVLWVNAESTIVKQETKEVTCDFDGIAVMDEAGTVYATVVDWDYDHQRERTMNIVQPFFARTPLAIYNGNVNYESGSVSGLFAPFDAKGNPDFTNLTPYRHKLLDWLATPTVKILKTYDGYIWRVATQSGMRDAWEGWRDAENVSFDWTEVADIPTTNMLRVVA